MVRSAIALCLTLITAGCSDPAPPPNDGGAGGDDAGPHGCATGFAGDAAKDVELTVTVLGATAGSAAVEVHDGDTVPLIFPPQGGRVIFAGVRATNLSTCGVTLTGAIRDPATKQVRLDARTVNLLPAADGWAETDATDYSSFSNIPVCPNQWSATDIYGADYELEVSVVDRDGRQATKKLSVKPACAEPSLEAECLCICQGGYVLGMSCAAPDAGTGDAGDGGGGSP